MAKKLKICSIFKRKEQPLLAIATWQWPSCTHSKTLSFRGDDNIFKTINSIFFDPFDGIETPQSSSSNSISIDEEIIKGARSERLFFKPDATSSIVQQHEEEIQENDDLPFKESIILAMESNDPYLDFKISMKEMVESQGIKDWDNLQELLAWYLKLNGEINHGFILGAFLDLLMELVFPITTPSIISDNSTTSYSSAASSSFSCPSSPLSSLGQKEIEEQEKGKVP
ncbi:putative nucleolar GTP-binding protein 1-like [Capsicum annuum]|uniref:Transcription repressor n=1 Tax=Capsicum annuum TaxID=4072 RepID=A0A2G2ZKJ1_CAPAN|nr:transcription repressor OFP13 [Capsicum annuum]KAF3617749.1 putative nucleolar GTP-binding protein 1-like [Capsicum annuum]PHT82493.1 hypothetical protein T459_15508 [Capsicum annuum]